MKRLEPLPVLFLLLAHGVLYNEIGELAAARGRNFAPLVELPIDSYIPFVPLFVLPYTGVWFLPLALVAYLVAGGTRPQAFRSMFAGLLVLMLSCYAMWIAFPVKVGLRLNEEVVAAHGWLGQLVVFNYRGASLWNACPSFHVAGPWFLYRAASLMAPRVPRVFLWTVVAIALSTVLIRIHYALDILFGLLVGELVVRFVFRPLHEARTLEQFPPRAAWAGSLGLLLAASMGYAWLSTV